jgi:hypothetical protein
MQAVIITTMSAYLVSTLALFLAGAIVTLALAHYRPSVARPIAAIFALLALALWLLAGRNLPLIATISDLPPGSNFPQMAFQVDQMGWELSFYLLLLVASVLLVLATRAERRPADGKGLSPGRAVPASILLLTGTTLVSLWAGLAISSLGFESWSRTV